jgi:hypothetical protein
MSRLWWGALIALVLALRLVTPAGFMPAVEHGQLTIIVCDDGGSAAPAQHHHGKTTQHHQQPCPYTTLSSFGAESAEHRPVPVLPVAIPVLLPWIAHLSVEGRRSHDRPPPRGPPLPA